VNIRNRTSKNLVNSKINLDTVRSYITKYEENGVPRLTDYKIEQIAQNVLQQYDSTLLSLPKEIPVIDILNYFKKYYDLKIKRANLGYHDNNRLRGSTIFSTQTIYIDKWLSSIEAKTLLRFTIAHELGHWILHAIKPIYVPEQEQNMNRIDDYETDFWGRKILSSTRDWIEHQANYFAGSLLLPELTFINAVTYKQKDMGVSRNIGIIYLDNQKGNIRDYKIIIEHIKHIYNVSARAVEIRLKQKDMLYEAPVRRVKHISELIF
jgi:Zn-dependent peptidase ImmA (M78 family)